MPGQPDLALECMKFICGDELGQSLVAPVARGVEAVASVGCVCAHHGPHVYYHAFVKASATRELVDQQTSSDTVSG